MVKVQQWLPLYNVISGMNCH